MDAVMAAEAPKLTGLSLDASYIAVPVAPVADQAASFAGKKQTTVLVRGEVDEADEDALRADKNVAGVWTDAPIAAFGDCNCPPVDSHALVSTTDYGGFGMNVFAPVPGDNQLPPPFSLETSTPCPPTDCDAGVAKGTIADVARYLNCDRLWGKGVRGAGVVIGICDTGVDKTKVPAVIGGWTPNATFPPGTDPGGHGTMCATDAVGMCPDAKIYDIGILKSTGGIAGTISDAIAAYQWALTQFNANGTPQILSNSWGMYQKAWAPDYATDPNHPFTRKVVEVIDKGIIVTFAAGNCGQVCPSGRCGSDTGPGRSIWGANGHPRVITVGAANIRNEWIGYTSQGPAALDAKKPDFCGISHFKGYTASDNGTSAANPVCAGVIGLLRGHDPTLTQDRAKKALQETAINICGAGWDQHSGFGIINAERAFNKLNFFTDTLIHASWIHGCAVDVEFPERLASMRRMGFYSLCDGQPNSFNWFHFAIPTPVIVDARRLRLDSVMLFFYTDADVAVTNVHVWDGDVRLQAYDGLSLSGAHPFERFDVLDRPVRWGICVSVGVRFGGAAQPHRIAFVSAGGDFIK
jgi:subtilisin family serine protease